MLTGRKSQFISNIQKNIKYILQNFLLDTSFWSQNKFLLCLVEIHDSFRKLLKFKKTLTTEWIFVDATDDRM